MFRKINHVFRPNPKGHRGREAGGGRRSEQDYHSACTVRLVRSTSMLVVGERGGGRAAAEGSTLKRSKSTLSVESTLYYYQRREDRIWLYSQNQNCLEYLEALVELRRRYTQSVSDLKGGDVQAADAKKKPAPPPPKQEKPVQRSKPSAPPAPTEEDSLQFFDSVIASCDNAPLPKPYMDDGHADVDFIVASSSAEHDLHSNWVLRVPRVPEDSGDKADQHSANKEKLQKTKKKKKSPSGSTSSRLRLQRNPIHLPKVVESAFQTLRFKPSSFKSKKQ